LPELGFPLTQDFDFFSAILIAHPELETQTTLSAEKGAKIPNAPQE
jgi:hypothetical protein